MSSQRKNAHASDWPRVATAYKKLVLSHGKDNVRLMRSGSVVSAHTIYRNERRHRHRAGPSSVHAPTEPKNLTFEIQTEDGNWESVSLTAALNGSLAAAIGPDVAQDTSQEVPRSSVRIGPEVSGHGALDRHGFTTPAFTYTGGPAMNSGQSPWLFCFSDDMLAGCTIPSPGFLLTEVACTLPEEPTRDPVDFYTDLVEGQFLDSLSHVDATTPPWSVLRHEGAYSITDLPFYRLERSLKLLGFDISSATLAEPVQRSSLGFYLQQRPFLQFVRDLIPSFSPLMNSSLAVRHTEDVFLQSILSLLPGQPVVACDSDQVDKSILRVLLFAFANNFPSFEGVQLSALLTFLGRFKDISKLFSLLKHVQGGNGYRKALAVGLFQAGIEAQQTSLVHQLLRLEILDVDTIPCPSRTVFESIHSNALERASYKGDMNMVRLLLNAKANPNAGLGFSGALEALFQGSQYEPKDRYVEIEECLLQQGARIEAAEAWLSKFGDIAFRTFDTMVREDHYVLKPSMRDLARGWEKGRLPAFEILRAIQQRCDSDHDGSCLGDLSSSECEAIRNGDESFHEKKLASSRRAILKRAASAGDYQTVQELLASPHINKDPDGYDDTYDALTCAVEANHHDIGRLIMGSLSDLQEVRPGDDFIEAAVRNRNVELVRYVLDSFQIARPHNFHREWQSTWFSELIDLGDYSCIRKAHEIFPLTLAETRHDGVALAGTNDNMLQFLLREKIIGVPALTKCLRHAVNCRNLQLIEKMLDLGANGGDIKVLSEAAMRDSMCFERLFQSRKTPTSWLAPKEQLYLLLSSLRNQAGDSTPLKLLLESGVIDVRGLPVHFDGFSMRCLPLYEAIEKWRNFSDFSVEAVRMLLQAGSELEQVIVEDPPQGNLTPLLAAIKMQSMPLINLFLERGADVNRPTDCGVRRTPLQLAAQIGHLDLVRLLLEKGARVDAAPAIRGGGTALQLAAISGNCNVANILVEAGASVHQEPSRFLGRWPLEGAAEHGRMDMIALLWGWAAPAGGFKDHIIEHAMELAVAEGHVACKELIEELRASGRGIVESNELVH